MKQDNARMERPIRILMVEDNADDVFLTREALRETKMHVLLNIVEDGAKALDFLRQTGSYQHVQRPDLILLDWNLPKKNGSEVLTEIKADPDLALIPVVILTTSEAEQDIVKAYSLHANCFITKPVDLEQFIRVVNAIEDFWLTIVKLPTS